MPFPSPGDLPNPGVEPASPTLTCRLFTIESSGKPTFNPMSLLNSAKIHYFEPEYLFFFFFILPFFFSFDAILKIILPSKLFDLQCCITFRYIAM